MSVLDRAIVRAFQRRHESDAVAHSAEAERRALEAAPTARVDAVSPMQVSSVDADAGSIRQVADAANVDAVVAISPVAPPAIPEQRPIYSTIREIPAATLPEPPPIPPATPVAEPYRVPEASVATLTAPVAQPTTTVSTSDPTTSHAWKWPEICQQLDQFTGEGFRQLAKHLQYAAEQGHKVLGFVSSTRNAGRTTVLMTLTRILALEGQTEVLLIDADRRHPQLAELSGQDPNHGLNELLRGEYRLPQVVLPMTPGRISLLPLTDTIVEAEWQTLVGPLRALLKQVRRDYDMVLIDVGVMGPETKLAECWLKGSVDAVITISRQLTGKRKEHEVLNWKQIGIESLGVIETFA